MRRQAIGLFVPSLLPIHRPARTERPRPAAFCIPRPSSLIELRLAALPSTPNIPEALPSVPTRATQRRVCVAGQSPLAS